MALSDWPAELRLLKPQDRCDAIPPRGSSTLELFVHLQPSGWLGMVYNFGIQYRFGEVGRFIHLSEDPWR
jgi:hypothetical protein